MAVTGRFSELSIHELRHLASQILFVLVFFQCIRWLYNRLTRRTISYLPGPRKSNWMFGNLTDLHLNEVGNFHVPLQKKYGHTFKIHGLFGEQYLMTSDQKAMQHIYSNPNTFIRQTNSRELTMLVLGPGLVLVNGDAHRRQRKVMQPAFGVPHLKALFPIYVRHAEKLSNAIKKGIDGGCGRRKTTMDLYQYLGDVALDIVGEAALDYQLGALDNKQDKLKDAIHMANGSYGNVTKLQLFFQYGLEWVPYRLIKPLSYLPVPKFSGLRTAGKKIEGMAAQIFQDKVNALAQGLEGGKDLMSLLIRANANQKESDKLSDREVMSEVATIIVAGHETTSYSLSFGLWELAKNMEMQGRLRKEIMEIRRRMQEEGRIEIGVDEFDHMPLLVAFIKEVLRFHPVGFPGGRQVMEDAIIPLSHPVKLETGEIVNEIPISKGQQLWVNILAYNRLPELWGPDADEFNIDRWLRSKEMPERGVGIYANLITFAHGPKACIGWRFSVWEMQMLLLELISGFEFSLPSNGKTLRRSYANLMMPTVKGEVNSKAALVLDVSVIEKD